MNTRPEEVNAPPTGKPARPGEAWKRILLVALTLWIAAVAIRIEQLNAAAGGVFPRREYHEDGHLTKWRESLVTNEARWRQFCGPRDERGNPTSRQLTDEERRQMVVDLEQARANNALRDFVIAFGQLQYLLVPLALALGINRVWFGATRRIDLPLGILGLVVAVAGGAIAWQRAYVGSLGW